MPKRTDYSLTFERLRTQNRLRCEEVFHPLDDWSATDWACAAAGELGEACNMIKKVKSGQVIDLRLIGWELADCVIYIDLLSQSRGIQMDLDRMIIEKFNLVSSYKGSRILL